MLYQIIFFFPNPNPNKLMLIIYKVLPIPVYFLTFKRYLCTCILSSALTKQGLFTTSRNIPVLVYIDKIVGVIKRSVRVEWTVHHP